MNHYEFPVVALDSELATGAFALERLRGDLSGPASTPPTLLAELHGLFQLLMSVVSARIEGNRTTIFDAVRAAGRPDPAESEREILALLDAMTFIDDADETAPLTHVFVRELHRRVVEGLEREGDAAPGGYRQVDVEIVASVRHRIRSFMPT